MKVYWVRHGQTSQNQKQTYYGKLDIRLTPEGIEEVKHIKTSFDNCLNVYVSPAARAMETASLLFSGVGFKVDSRLLERHMGVFEGLTYNQIGAQFPNERMLWQKDWKNYSIPEGESANDQYQRVKSFVKELEAIGEDCVVIAHAGTIRMALVYVMGEDLETFWKFKVDTGTVVTTHYDEGYWYIEFSAKYQ